MKVCLYSVSGQQQAELLNQSAVNSTHQSTLTAWLSCHLAMILRGSIATFSLGHRLADTGRNKVDHLDAGRRTGLCEIALMEKLPKVSY